MRETAPAHYANNIDGLRLCAALIVIFGHEFSIRGFEQPVIFGSHVASLGVKIFFSLSGYLIAQSFERDPDAWRFFLRRALRIVPGLTACVLATVFLLGPLATPLGLDAYFRDPSTWVYLWNIAFGFVETIPALFAGNPLPDAVNGSLWSLPPEAAMYGLLLIGGIACSGSLLARAIVTLAAFFVFVAAVCAFGLFGWNETLVYGTRLSAFCVVAGFFCAGALLWQLRARVPLRLDVAAASGLVAWLSAGTLLFPLLEPLALTYGLLAIGLRSTPGVRDAARFGDVSYGLYLYAYPLQQLTRQVFGPDTGFVPALGISLCATFLCAFVSWHCIEKRFLRYKPRAASAASVPRAGAPPGSRLPSPQAAPVKTAVAHSARQS